MSLSNSSRPQAFQSSEALKSHQKKHCLSLRLTTAALPVDESGQQHEFATPPVLPIIREEMPTPRRFLKEFEQNSAFLDEIVGEGSRRGATSPTVRCLNENLLANPFAETFRRASFSKELSAQTNQTNELQVPQESESLNTPSILFNATNENPLAHLSQRCISEEDGGRESPPSHLHHKPAVVTETSIIKQALKTADIPLNDFPSTPQPDAPLHDVPEVRSDNHSACPQSIAITNATHTVPVGPVPTVAMPFVYTIMPVASPLTSSSTRQKSRILPKPGLSTSQVIGVTLKLADGKSLVVPVDAAPAASLLRTPATAPVQKLRLLSQKAVSTVNRTTADEQASDASVNACPVKTLQSSPPKLLKAGRKKKGFRGPSVEEKRRQEMIRNTESARRYRMKKNQRTQDAEERANALLDMNNRLQLQVVALRNEVLSLKTALMAHRECSVTLQQLRLTVQPDNAGQ